MDLDATLPASERGARLLARFLVGADRVGPEKRIPLRGLCGRIEAWVAPRGPEAETWRRIVEDPEGRRDQLAELLDRVAGEDVVARRYLHGLVPPCELPTPLELTLHDFVLQIQAHGDLQAGARLIQAPLGRLCESDLDLDFCDGGAESWLRAVVPKILHSRYNTVISERVPPPVVTERLGERMFEALFQGALRTAWSRHMAWLEGRRDVGLRVRLVFDLAEPTGRRLAALPWELMRDRETGRVLAKSVRTPLLRSLEAVGERRAPATLRQPRILLLRSQPAGAAPLAVDVEERALSDVWRTVPGVQVRPAVAHLASLRELLQAQPFAVLHFMGHGAFVDGSRQGVLVFEAETGEAQEVPAEILVEQVAGLGLELVILSACETGGLGSGDQAEAFGGVAAALVREGVPAVVAMQFPVSDAAAVAFDHELVRRLAAGDSLEVAVTEGRLAVSGRRPASLEWATPVLYQRA